MILVLPVLTGRHTFKLFWPVHSTFHFMSVSKGGLLETMSKTNKKHQEHVLFLKSISPSIQQNNINMAFSLLGRFLPRQGLTILWDRFWILDCVCNEMWQYSVSSYLDVLDTFYCSLDMCCLGMMQDLQGRWCKPSYLSFWSSGDFASVNQFCENIRKKMERSFKVLCFVFQSFWC